MVVKYDVLASSFTVISSNKVPVSKPNPASCNNNNNPPKQVPQVDPMPYPPKQVPQVDPMPPLGPIGCIACRDPLPVPAQPNTNSQGNVPATTQIFV